MKKSWFQLSKEVGDAIGKAHPNVCDVATYHGCAVYLEGTPAYGPIPEGPAFVVSVEKPTERPSGVPEQFEYEGVSYKIVYQVRERARAL